jgi:nicotinamide-nucleotide amidase
MSADTELHALVSASGLSIAVAESLTGGQLSARLAALPDASEWFRGGIVAYAAEVKYDLLGVPRGPVVSAAAAAAMAEGTCRVLGADVAIAVTGVGGPDPAEGEPPGTGWFALHHGTQHEPRKERFSGEPVAVLRQTSDHAIAMLTDHLTGVVHA